MVCRFRTFRDLVARKTMRSLERWIGIVRLSFYHQLNTIGVDENDSADFEFNDSFCIERGHLFVGGIKRAFEEIGPSRKVASCKASLRYYSK